jgi:hypothetical protein
MQPARLESPPTHQHSSDGNAFVAFSASDSERKLFLLSSHASASINEVFPPLWDDDSARAGRSYGEAAFRPAGANF